MQKLEQNTKPGEQLAPEVSNKKPQIKWPSFSLLAKIILWQIIAVLFVETCLFAAGLGEEEIFKLDPELGFTHMTNKKVTWRSEGSAVSYLNWDGLREHNLSLAKPAGTIRVALLGDSLTESLQVPLEQSFSYKLEKSLTEKFKSPVQVINFGCSGYSTVQEYLQLKKQVLKYKPDLVLLCYNNRDCFENWSAPDEVLTNVRPLAMHLPGAKLVVDSAPVRQWMKTPRARLLKTFEFLRVHSRLWGLFAAAELNWSMKSEAYKRVILFLSRPGKALRLTASELGDKFKALAHDLDWHSKKKTDAPAPTAAAKAAPASPQESSKESSNGSSKKSSLTAKEKSPQAKAAKADTALPEKKAQTSTQLIYQQLVTRTLGSLLEQMKLECQSQGSDFAVVALPVRSALYAKQGLQTSFSDFEYKDEISMLKAACLEKSLPFIDMHEPAKKLSARDRDYLFYLVHLTPRGHEFLEAELREPASALVAKKMELLKK